MSVGEDQPILDVGLAKYMVAAYAHKHAAPDLAMLLDLELSLPG